MIRMGGCQGANKLTCWYFRCYTAVNPLVEEDWMDILEAIHGRRSIKNVKPDLPPRSQIEAMLEAATWAPNHYHVEPWRFFVLTGASRQRLGEVMGEVARKAFADPNSQVAASAAEK